MLENELISARLKRYQEENCSQEEKKIIEDWYQQQLELSRWDFSPKEELLIGAKIKGRVYKELHLPGKTIFSKDQTGRKWGIIARVAAIVILASTAGIYFWRDKAPATPLHTQLTAKTIAPERNHAVLTLANGEKIILDSLSNSKSLQQGNAQIQQLSSGQLSYRSLNGNPSVVAFNTLTTPKGRQYELRLPDGTKIWLNAASSITYPTVFSGKVRSVTITGEVYFEVVHNTGAPFQVRTGGTTIEVLGTHFNVNAYSDEPSIKTTLVEGKVKVSENGQICMLAPGQQASVTQRGIVKTKDVNLEQVMGWKNGKFILDKVDVYTLMRQVARWYDLEVIYNGPVSQHFWGTVSQEMTAPELFKMLESTGGAHFKLEGKKIIVSP